MKKDYKKPDTFRVRQPHTKECFAILNFKNGKYVNPWCGTCIEQIDYGSIRSPDQRGHVGWVTFRCMDPSCPALLSVKGDFLLREAPCE